MSNPDRRQGFVNGENFRALEDAILDKIDRERAAEEIANASSEGADEGDGSPTKSKAKRRRKPAYRRPKRGSMDKLKAAVLQEGDEAVFKHIAAGKTMAEVGEVFGLDRDSIYKWIGQGGAERKAAWEVAKRRSADALVEQGMKILDEGENITNTAQASIARSRAEYRKWLAGCRDRAEYGDSPATAVQVNLDLGQLHLEALKQRGRMELAPGPEEPPVLEGEVVEDGRDKKLG